MTTAAASRRRLVGSRHPTRGILSSTQLGTNPDGGVGGMLTSGPAGQPRWFQNATEFGVSDGTRNRIEIGNLGAYTDPSGVTSPAGWQIRSVDANGYLIFDSLGLAGTLTPYSANLGASGSTSSTSGVSIISLQVTLTRPANFLIFGTVSCNTSTTTGIGSARTYIAVDDASLTGQVANTSTPDWDSGNEVYSATAVATTQIGAGTHTIYVSGYVRSGSDPSTVFHWWLGNLIAVKLGN